MSQNPQQIQSQAINNNNGGFWKDTKPSVSKLSTIDPQQQQYQQGLLQQAPNLLQTIMQQLGQPAQKSQFDFAPIAQQARTQFNTQTVPGLAERFAGLGGDSRGSSAVTGQIGAAGAGLDEGLASLQQHYGLQQQQFDYGAQQDRLQQLMQLFSLISGQALGQNHENIYDPGQAAGYKQLIGNFASALGGMAGKYLGTR